MKPWHWSIAIPMISIPVIYWIAIIGMMELESCTALSSLGFTPEDWQQVGFLTPVIVGIMIDALLIKRVLRGKS